jgi:hypothetical protein
MERMLALLLLAAAPAVALVPHDASVWHGPTRLIFGGAGVSPHCPELSGVFGSASTTVAECQALSTTHKADAINYNTDPSCIGPRCQLRNCSIATTPTWSVPFWEGYATFPVPPMPPPAPPAPGLMLSRVTLTEAAASDGAVCLDGSAPVYYWRPGSGSGAKSWVLFLEVRCQRPPRSSSVALSSTLTS